MSKNEKIQGKATNPMIGLITNLVASINGHIKARMVPEAVNDMVSLLAVINPAHQDSVLKKALNDFSLSKRKTVDKHIRADLIRCREYMGQIMAILWKYGYWTDEGWGFRDLTGGKPRR